MTSAFTRPSWFFALALATPAAAQVKVHTSPAAGLGAETAVGRLGPSDIYRFGERDLVLYTRVEATDPLYPAPYAGEIWYAVSEDGGHSWREGARVLGPGEAGSFDRLGVFDPAFVRGPAGRYWLYYTGAGPDFNERFERVERVAPLQIGVAQLEIDPAMRYVRASRANDGEPILVPRLPEEHRFDSLRVQGAIPLVRNGLFQLYYRAHSFDRPSDAKTLGLATALDAEGPYRRHHEGRPVSPFGGDVLLGNYAGGVLALLTGSGRGLYWAADGEHFAPVPVHVLGRLNDAGVWRGESEEGARLWGLHVARLSPDPYLERFEFEHPDPLPLPPRATIPAPNAVRATQWGGAGWLAQHRRCLEALRSRPRDVYFLGGGIVEGLGGHGRVQDAPGAAAWRAHFATRDAVNLGIAGDRTQHLLWRLSHGVLDRPRVRAVVLQLEGAQLAEDPAAEVAAGAEFLVQRLVRRMPDVQVVLGSLLPARAGEEERARAIAEVNAQLRELGRDPRVHFVDLDARFADSSGHLWPELARPNSDHLTPAGYAEWVAAFLPVLEQIEAAVPEEAARRLGELGPEEGAKEE